MALIDAANFASATYNRPMPSIADLANDQPSARIWVRGTFLLASGRRITRTVRSEVAISADAAERRAILAYELIEELENAGYEFPEGRGLLVELLGVASG